jgi:hypothetical protein
MVKDLAFPYDLEQIRPKVRIVFFGASPLTYLCVFGMVILIAVLFRIPLLWQKAIVAVLLVLDLIVVGYFVSGLLREYSRRTIAQKNHTFKISSDRIQLYVPTYNPWKILERTIKPSELEAVGLFFASKKKVGDLVFYFKDGSELEFEADQLDMGTYNLEVVLKEAGYPTRRYQPKA